MNIILEITNLPDNFKKTAINLDTEGLAGYAWPLEEAIELVSWLNGNTNYILLGGDLYLYIQGKKVIHTMRENWHYEARKSTEDHENSIKKARDFLSTFITHPMRPEIVVNFVLDQPQV